MMAAIVIALGLANHNPGNISPRNLRGWPGAVGYDVYGHAKFLDDRHGLMAIKKNLEAYWHVHRIDTCREIATRWASPQIRSADLLDYISTLEIYTGAGPDDRLDMKDMGTLESIGHGIAREETGVDPYHEWLWAAVFQNRNRSGH